MRYHIESRDPAAIVKSVAALFEWQAARAEQTCKAAKSRRDRERAQARQLVWDEARAIMLSLEFPP